MGHAIEKTARFLRNVHRGRREALVYGGSFFSAGGIVLVRSAHYIERNSGLWEGGGCVLRLEANGVHVRK